MHFSHQEKVLFKHCDPAGIVFFPRYAEMVNDVVEAFFDQHLQWPFELLHQSAALPTAQISFQFSAPSRHGDQLSLQMTIQKIGNASMALSTAAYCQDELRFVADQTLVLVDQGGRPQRWPDNIRTRVNTLMENSN
ncbi:MAG: acyl-CoA thioesterase [Gammaproteobacteria bacterium]|nr:acyl-CoA thioesterase [Gammaproteobacteria bacterium]